MAGRFLSAAFLLCGASAEASAGDSFVRAFVGGWAYDITGTITNTSELDFKDDLGLKSTDRKMFAVGVRPADFGWLPSIELDYVRIAARGQQAISTIPPGAQQLFGLLPITSSTVVQNRTNVDDVELTARWPYQIGAFTLAGGLKVARVNGVVVVADENTGQQQRQPVNETFPLVSLGVDWEPLPSLRFSLSGDYIQYNGNRADELEARVLWKVLGPVGLEAGYLQRRYKIVDAANRLNARVAGARIGTVIEIPY